MSLVSLKNKIRKRVEVEQYKQNYTDIGTFIKEKRKELDYTQDEICNGICSISYLSKIENNQIVPNDFYVKEILEKLDVEENVLSASLKEKQYLHDVLEATFYMNAAKMDQVYDDIKDIEHNVIINLCKLGYNVYYKLEAKNHYVMMLENLINNMTDFEIGMYLYFSSIYYIQLEKYKMALELALLYDSLRSKEEKLEALFYELSYLVKQRLLVKNSSNEDYAHAMTLFSKYHNVERVMFLALNKCYHLREENPKCALKILKTVKIDLLNKEMSDMYSYIKASSEYSLEKYKKTVITLNSINDQSKYYLRKMNLLYEICLIEEDYKTIEDIKKILVNVSPIDHEVSSKVYYHYLTQETNESKKEFLRDIAIPFSIQIEDYRTLKVYTDNLMEICIESSRYKEALQFYKKYQKEVLKIQKILY